jgi:hypothetical protein
MVNNTITEVTNFNYLGYQLGRNRCYDLLYRFNYLRGTIELTLIQKPQREKIRKFYEVL